MTGNSTSSLQIYTLNEVMIEPNLFKYFEKVNLICYLLLIFSALYCVGNKPITTIAFGSCLKETRPQPIWESVVDVKPDIFVLLGDNIYGDTRDMSKLREKWNKFNSILVQTAVFWLSGMTMIMVKMMRVWSIHRKQNLSRSSLIF